MPPRGFFSENKGRIGLVDRETKACGGVLAADDRL